MAFKGRSTASGELGNKTYFWSADIWGNGVRTWVYVTADAAATVAASAYIDEQDFIDILDVGDQIWVFQVTSISDARDISADFATGLVVTSIHVVASNDGTTVDLSDDQISGILNVVEDTTPQLGGAVDGQGFDLNNLGVVFLTEQAAAEADVAGKGQFWVQTATPNIPMFTDDAGTDIQLSGLLNIVEDTTPQLGGALDGQGFDLNNVGVVFLTEQAAAEADVAGKGQFWVKTATPNVPMFTDDVGTDIQLPSYASSTWTPALTFTTPGDLSVAYNIQVGAYVKVGKLVFATFYVSLSTFTHTTASGDLNITGVPFTSSNVSNQNNVGGLSWAGITKASYTNVITRLGANSSILDFPASGSGQAISNIAAADMPSAGGVVLNGSIVFEATV